MTKQWPRKWHSPSNWTSCIIFANGPELSFRLLHCLLTALGIRFKFSTVGLSPDESSNLTRFSLSLRLSVALASLSLGCSFCLEPFPSYLLPLWQFWPQLGGPLDWLRSAGRQTAPHRSQYAMPPSLFSTQDYFSIWSSHACLYVYPLTPARA